MRGISSPGKIEFDAKAVTGTRCGVSESVRRPTGSLTLRLSESYAETSDRTGRSVLQTSVPRTSPRLPSAVAEHYASVHAKKDLYSAFAN